MLLVVVPGAHHCSAPANAEVWLKHMVKSEVQGCGHIRLMLASNTSRLPIWMYVTLA